MNNTVAIYCRTGKKNNAEIERQKEILIKLSKELRYDNFVEYIDNGYKDDDYERPAWKKMRKDACLDKFDMILVTDYSRITRDIQYIRKAEWLDNGYAIDIHCPEGNVIEIGYFELWLTNRFPQYKQMSKKTALYSRSATDNKQSIYKQTSALNNYCEENNIQNFKHYIDNHQSGANLDRPAFKEMMQDLEAGKIDKIIVKDISRITRNFSELGHIIHRQIEPNQAKLITLDNGEYRLDDYNPESGFLQI